MREWLQILGLVLLATCGLLVLQVLYDDFRSLRELGARGAVLWKYMGIRLPSFLALVLPVALLISVMFVLGKLHRANELTAMRAAGVGFLRLTAPIWCVGLLCCGLMWWLNTTIVPWSVEESRDMHDELEFQRDAKMLTQDRVGASYSVGFDNAHERRMWMFNRYSKFTRKAYGVTVSELDGRRHELTRYLAAEASYNEKTVTWTFKKGRELTFSPETGVLTGSAPFEEKVMAKYHEDPELMLLIDRRPNDLSLHELKELIDYLEAEGSPKSVAYSVRYHGLIADTILPLLVIAMAIPFAVSGVRVNPAVGVSKSIGLFFLYNLLTTMAASLATKGLVDPATSAWLPNLVVLGLAAYFFARLR